MTRKEMVDEIRRRTSHLPPYMQRMVETTVLYCTWRNISTEHGADQMVSAIYDRGKRVTAFLVRHRMLTGEP